MPTVLITGAGGSASANVIDALQRAETHYDVVGADISPIRLHLSQAAVRCLLPRPDHPSYLSALLAAIKTWDVDVVHAQPDGEVKVVGQIRDELGDRTFLPTQDVLAIAGDKGHLAERMRQAGVPTPESLSIERLRDVGEVTACLLSRHDRVWIRARVGAGARASLPVGTPEQAEAWVRWWIDERDMRPSDFMASELLPNREFAFQSVWQNGQLIAGQARERLEYLYGFLAPSGQSSTPAVARTANEPHVDATAIAAIRALDPHPNGVYCVDLKEDASKRPKVTEINAGRFFTTSNFFAAAGLNMPEMAVRAALGERLKPLGAGILPADLYWIRMVDMGYTLVPGDELDRWPRPGA
jgi:carbamoyl-phosphate synthase large subunit